MAIIWRWRRGLLAPTKIVVVHHLGGPVCCCFVFWIFRCLVFGFLALVVNVCSQEQEADDGNRNSTDGDIDCTVGI